MKRLICWWHGHHDFTDWRQGILISYRICNICQKEEVRERVGAIRA